MVNALISSMHGNASCALNSIFTFSFEYYNIYTIVNRGGSRISRKGGAHLKKLRYIKRIAKIGLTRGGSREGGGPPKIGKNMIFWRKIVIFHTK
jgi:hypothetical protein